MEHKLTIDNIDFDKLEPLIIEKLPVNVLRQLITIFSILGRTSYGDKFVSQKDAIIKSMAFHIATLSKINASEALTVLLDEREAMCARASAIEFLVEYYQENPVTEISLRSLYHNVSGETPYTFYLLRLLSFPEIRSQVPNFIDFIIPYLSLDSTPIFTISALHSLYQYDFEDEKLIKFITKLVSVEEYINPVLYIIKSLSDETISQFGSDLIYFICENIETADIGMALDCLNRILMIGSIEFPEQSMEQILSLYSSFISANCSSSALHSVMSQIFKVSAASREIALNSGFLSMILQEFHAAEELMQKEEFCSLVLTTCSQFVYEYNDAQNELIRVWGIPKLISIFNHSNYFILTFFLCLTKNNPDSQGCFIINEKSPKGSILPSLLDKIIESLDSTKKNKYISLLFDLFCSILNSYTVRNKVYINQKLIPSYVARV